MNINIYVNEEPDNILKDGKKDRRIDVLVPIELWQMFDDSRKRLGLTIKALVVKSIASYLFHYGYDDARIWI